MRGQNAVRRLVIGMLVGAAAASAQQPQGEDRCAAVAKIGRVLATVASDAPCKLTINGEPAGTLTANKPQEVRSAGGEQVYECTAADGKERAREVRRVEGGCSTVDFVVAGPWTRFKEEKDGTVRDTATRLLWKASDNGGDTDWESAKKHCEAAKARLPTRDELKALHDDSGALFTDCGDADCRVSRKFRLSGRFFWSGTPGNEDQIFIVGFAGDRPTMQSVEPITAKDLRVLCVAGS